MTEFIQVPAEIVLARMMAVRTGNIVQGAGKHILIACMPKSASTYLTGLLNEVAGVRQVVITVGHHRREQELCPFECALFHDLNYVAQAHVRYSQATQLIMTRFGIVPVILVRNIEDCVVSMREHLLNEDID